ncbi:MAG: chemotaxis protein CheW [Nevskia sp.]|nr:chemotaxis protein CheW [Nevskia sp.]
MDDRAPDQLYAVLIALQGDTLLLPNLAVTEVVSTEGLRRPSGCAPWLAGLLAWQGRELPVARFELLNNGAAAPDHRRTRVVIVNAVTARIEGGHYGLIAEGHPHLVTLNRAALRPAERRPQDSSELVLARVRVASQEAAIPNLEKLEEALAGALAAHGPGTESTA